MYLYSQFRALTKQDFGGLPSFVKVCRAAVAALPSFVKRLTHHSGRTVQCIHIKTPNIQYTGTYTPQIIKRDLKSPIYSRRVYPPA